MTVHEFEQKVWELDNIRLVIRANPDENVGAYEYKRASQENWRLTEFFARRIRPKIGEFQVVVIHGDGELSHGSTLLRTIKRSYNRQP